MIRISRLAAGLVALAAPPALALDLGNGFSVVGEVELEYLFNDDDNSTSALVDVTFGWRSAADGGFGFGADLALVALEGLEGSNASASAIWGGPVLTTGLGEVTIGNPRSLVETSFDTPQIGGVGSVESFFDSLFAGGLTLELAGLTDGVDSYGVRFNGNSGALTYGALYSVADGDGNEVDFLELVGGYDLGATTLQVGFERIGGDVDDRDRLFFGAEYAADAWSAGALFTRAEAGGAAATTTQVYGDFRVAEGFTLGAQFLNFDPGSGGDLQLYGLTGEYGFGPGGFAQLGVLDGSNSLATTYSASIGFRF